MRSTVEGAPLPTRVHDSENHPFEIAQLACEPHRPDRSLQHTRAPSTGLRPVPLPVPGRNDHDPRLFKSAVRSVVQTNSSL
jgi:hypothetical protein